MKRTLKKYLSLTFALMLLLSMCSVTAFAAEADGADAEPAALPPCTNHILEAGNYTRYHYIDDAIHEIEKGISYKCITCFYVIYEPTSWEQADHDRGGTCVCGYSSYGK